MLPLTVAVPELNKGWNTTSFPSSNKSAHLGDFRGSFQRQSTISRSSPQPQSGSPGSSSSSDSQHSQ
ncbi:hypothetical protein SFRURICE_006246 [Spodoptera frugiperda]|nr:hypothetical protein SFRURICE_006246 [Spodoptera frugiperda]